MLPIAPASVPSCSASCGSRECFVQVDVGVDESGQDQTALCVYPLGGRNSSTRAHRRDLPAIDLQIDEITISEARIDKREAHLHSPRTIPALRDCHY